MKIKLSLAALVIFLSFAAANAQKPTTGNTAEKPDTGAAKTTADDKVTINSKFTADEYKEMLKKLKDGDMSINFAAFRLAFTETDDYSPYGGSEERSEMFAFLEEDGAKAVKAAENILKTNYTDIIAHYVAWKANYEIGDDDKAEFHEKVFNGLMDAIFENDGLSAKTGLISIGISEQYFVMSYKGYRPKMKSLTREEGSMFDVHDAVNSETGQTRKFYFNINKVFGRF